MDVAGRHILVVGLGVSGVAAAQFLKARGATVTAADTASEQELGRRARQMREMGLQLELGPHRPEAFEHVDLVVLSPGVRHDLPVLERAREKGIQVLGEVELASRFIEEPIVAVTGTNGKTTTTELLGSMLAISGLKVFVGGNIGNPLIGYAGQGEKVDIVVAEVSSFQLDTIETFRPAIGLLLNITPDHLDRYEDFGAYARAKVRIFENQKQGDGAVLNGADAFVLDLCSHVRSRKMIYRYAECSKSAGRADAEITGACVRVDLDAGPRGNLDLSRSSLLGRHNLENVAAACLAALAAGGTFEGIQAAVDGFKGLSHRLEPIGTIGGVRFCNDSKATNVDAVAKALNAFSRPVVLIMGGRDKGSDFHALRDSVKAHVKHILAMGEAAEAIRAALGETAPVTLAAGMKDAVVKGHLCATPGDTVILSPACASFDMFSNYAERGEAFRRAVEQLREEYGKGKQNDGE